MKRKIFKVSIIVPFYNMENEVERTAGQLTNYMEKNFEKYEVIFVNDGSLDKSLAKLQKRIPKKNVKLISLRNNRGKGFAIKKGIKASSGDFILFTDADLPYDLQAIKYLIGELLLGYDVVLGSRQDPKSKFLVKEKLHRKILSAVFSRIANLVLIEEIIDTQCGLKGFSKKSADAIFSKAFLSGFAFDVEVIYLAQKYGYKIKLIPVKLVHDSKSTVNFKHMFSMLSDVGMLLKRSKFN